MIHSLSFGRKADVEKFSFNVSYPHREWNHICWTLDGLKMQVSFFFNGYLLGKSIANYSYSVSGAPKFKSYLLFGQEPDSWMGEFDEYQAFQGKLAGFNWWSSVLPADQIEALSKCRENVKGDVVSWKSDLFTVKNALIERITDTCSPRNIWLFFPGRRTHSHAENLCARHGGSIVVPKTETENTMILEMYLQNKNACAMEGENAVGWIGVKTLNRIHFMTEPQQPRIDLNYTNFYRLLEVKLSFEPLCLSVDWLVGQ